MTAATRRLYFHHIPKTAGSSVKAWLRSHFGDRLCPADVADQLVLIPPARCAGYQAFGGHFHGYLGPYLGRDLMAVTVLREPLARTRSHWHQVRRHEQHPHYPRVHRQSFTEFVMDDLNRVMIEEYQARYLVKLPVSMAALATGLSESDHARYALSEKLEQLSLHLPKPALLEGARSALQEMAVVGVTETLHDFLVRVAEFAAIPPPSAERVPRANVTDANEAEALSEAAAQRLRSLTHIDQELYEVACRRRLGPSLRTA